MFIKFNGASELALRYHDDTLTSENPGIYADINYLIRRYKIHI